MEHPQVSKKRTVAVDKPEKKLTEPPSSQASAPRIGKTGNRPGSERILDELDALHKRTNVAGNLKLGQNQRLKLESADVLSKKRKIRPNFDIEFANLNESMPSTSNSYDVTDIDDDDLPEAHDILQAPAAIGTSPSDTNYSNSEIDALICALPLPSDQGHEKAGKLKTSKETSSGSTTTSLSLPKHAMAIESTDRARKRARFEEDESDSESIRISSPVPQPNWNKACLLVVTTFIYLTHSLAHAAQL